METSHTMRFCDGALLASFSALGSGGLAVNASGGIVAFARGPRGLRLVALGGAFEGGDRGTDGGGRAPPPLPPLPPLPPRLLLRYQGQGRLRAARRRRPSVGPRRARRQPRLGLWRGPRVRGRVAWARLYQLKPRDRRRLRHTALGLRRLRPTAAGPRAAFGVGGEEPWPRFAYGARGAPPHGMIMINRPAGSGWPLCVVRALPRTRGLGAGRREVGPSEAGGWGTGGGWQGRAGGGG
jgi:hypothetical protein